MLTCKTQISMQRKQVAQIYLLLDKFRLLTFFVNDVNIRDFSLEKYSYRHVNYRVITQISTSVRQTMEVVTPKLNAPTRRAVFRVAALMVTKETALPAQVINF